LPTRIQEDTAMTERRRKRMTKAALRRKRDSWRDHECRGCRSNIYNWPETSGKNPRDLTACAHKLSADHVCWNLEDARRIRYEEGTRLGQWRKLDHPRANCHQGGLHGGRR
jgi:hypothetical protein